MPVANSRAKIIDSLEKPLQLGERCLDLIEHRTLRTMSPIQAPSSACTANYPQTRTHAALIRAEFLHLDTFYSGLFLEEGDAAMRKRVDSLAARAPDLSGRGSCGA